MLKIRSCSCWITLFLSFIATGAFAAGTLPEGYTEIEYVQGPGNGRFVTDYTPQPNTDKIEAVVEWPANTIAANVNQAVWCARGNGTQVDSWTLFDLGTQFRFDYMPNGHAVSLIPNFTIATGTKYTITAEDNKVTYSANGMVLDSQDTHAYSFAAGSVLALFASHYNGINANLGNYGKHRLYSFKVWRSGELIHYFVPCKDLNGAATLVDLCDSPATLTKSGTFGAGPDGHFYDDSLFTIPDDRLVVSGIPGNYGSPSPAYGRQTNLLAGDTFTVSCGATVVTNGSTECIYQGWKLCDAIGNVLTNGLESSFTYEHPTPAEGRRLVWEWKVRPVGADATDLLPTLCLTFDEQTLANTGTGSISVAGGTPTYVESEQGYALDTPTCAPYGSISGVFAANRDSAIAAVAKLATKSTGILFHFKNGNTSIMLRRGKAPNQLVLTENNSSSALITVNDIEEGDTKYHLYVINILSDRVDLYVDGVFAGTTTTTPRAADLVNWQFGGRHGGVISGEAICGGPIDDLRVYASALSTKQMIALADSLLPALSIRSIPSQHVLPGIRPEPGFTIANRQTGEIWVFGEGGVASGATPFDIAYSYADGVGTVTAIGKVGSEAEGKVLTKNFVVSDNLLLNGGFESGVLSPGWTGSNSTLSTVINASDGHKPNQTTTFITGTYCGMLKMTSSMQQVFTNASPCRVKLSWKCKHRCDWGAATVYYSVLLDDEVIYPEEAVTGSDVRYRSVEDLILSPGEHTLKFDGRTDNNADTSLFLDDISLQLITPLVILPIPDQAYNFGDECRPEFTVSNIFSAATWKIGGNIQSADFDVSYANNDNGVGVATVTATGKGALLGNVVSANYNLVATHLEDDNIFTSDPSVRRYIVDGKYVYVFTNAASAQAVTTKRSLQLTDCLLVGGGGAGGATMAGGGGGGGVTNISGLADVSIQASHTFTVAVGAGGIPNTSQKNKGGNGGATSLDFGGFFASVAGGGGGGSWSSTAGANGASGGGGCQNGASGAGIAGIGFDGAAGAAASTSKAGGGGGAGHAGYQAANGRAGYGGEGVSNNITGAWVVYGGGGGAGGSSNGWGTNAAGLGGLGGGGNGGKGTAGEKGVDGLGGGGGGGGWNGSDKAGGQGGSGTVILSIQPNEIDVNLTDQVWNYFTPCRPELTVSNLLNGTTWTVGGDNASPYFDVEYFNNVGTGTARVVITGKGDCAGMYWSGSFDITATQFEDENITTTDLTAKRLEVDGRYVYVFTNTVSAQTVTANRMIALDEFLLVGGGGGGGCRMAGGGGAGGVTNAAGVVGVVLPRNGTFTLAVGAGGAGGVSDSLTGGVGGDTELAFGPFAVTAFGGGGGAGWSIMKGAKGGSGGGGANNGGGGDGIAGFGFAGAASLGSNNSGSGGGGGAGHAGYKAVDGHSGYGGEGVSNRITGAWVVYGGGGGAGGSGNGYSQMTAGLGGLGGGGNGSRGIDGNPGTDGLGGGGGGGGYGGGNGYISTYVGNGGKGGSGIAILAIKATDFAVEPIPDQVFVGGVSEPIPVVYAADGETLLVKDEDYTVSYTDNDRGGYALATITGINGYAGKSTVVSFRIIARIYAKPSVASEGDGTSWAAAMSVAKAFETLANASGYNELWMQKGIVSQPAFSITNSGTLFVRGGFAGTETTLAERQPGALTVFDGEKASSILLKLQNAVDGESIIDRIKFCRAKSNGFVKTGIGGLQVYDCVIEANGRDVGMVYGRGMNVDGGGFGSLVVSNCVFAGNRCVSGDTQYGGFGLYAYKCKTALVDDSLFVTNGYDLTIQPVKNYAGYQYARGSAILADDSPITVRNSRFAGNCCPVRKKNDTSWCGGTIALRGACGGSVIDNCTLIGNTEYVSVGSEGPDCGGAIAVRMNSASAKAAVRNCTIAYNLTQCSAAAGGITVYRGNVDIVNTILWKNDRYHVTIAGYGKDVHVGSSGSARISHSLVTSLAAADEYLVGANLVIDSDTVFAADPKLVTSTADFESLVTVTDSAQYYTYTNPSIYEDLASMDAHLLSPAGYWMNDGAAGPATVSFSPAIDRGDPDADCSKEPSPNGDRLNLGAYGNTAEASLTATGQPSANVSVTFPDGFTQPLVTITMGLHSGSAYVATVHLLCQTGGVTVVDKTFQNVGNGDVLTNILPDYLPPGTPYTVSVLVVAASAETVYKEVTENATGTLPPFYGKGGGPNVIHVREGANGLKDGTSWMDAYSDLKSAFASALDASKTEVWLAVSDDCPKGTVTISNPIKIRGGFTGVENSPDERPEGHRSTIDGRDAWDGLLINNTAAVDIERIIFTRGLNCGLVKSGAGDMRVSDCIFMTNGTERAGNASGKGARVSGTKTTTIVTFTNCVFRGNRVKTTFSGACAAQGSGINGSSLKCLRLEDSLFVHNGNYLRTPGGAHSSDSSTGNFSGSAVYSSAPVSAVGCRFIANFGTVINSNTSSGGSGGTVRLASGAEGSAFTNCAWVANGEEISWPWNNKGPNESGALVVHFGRASGTVDVERCTFAYNLIDGHETTAGLNLSLGTANIHNSIFYGNILGGTSSTRGRNILLRGESVCNVSYTLFGELGSNSVSCAETATTNFLGGIVVADPRFVTENATMTNLVKKSGNLIFWDWTTATAAETYAALEAADVHLRSTVGYLIDGQLFKYKENSPAIDAGDPASDFHGEPDCNIGWHGKRVNLGAYGNTSEAAMTALSGFLFILR